MLNIGEFARAGGVTVRMLRHYDQLGLLTPAEVDPWSGRRRYDLSQLGKLHRIVTLKELGFTLGQVADLLAEGVGAGELRGMLRLRRTELLTQVNEVRHRLAQLDARLRLIESESEMTVTDEIVLKRAEPTRIAAVEGTDADGVENLFIRAGELMDAAGLSRLTPVGWFLPETEESRRFYAGFAVTEQAPNGLEIIELPTAEVASVIHRGAMPPSAAYETLTRWAEKSGRDVGAKRWIFLEANGEDQSNWVVEVQLELL
jgi:DNA-binding transcriptional MerR regulator